MNEEAEIIDIGQARRDRAVRTNTGGNGPSAPSSNNWLAGLPNGTRFLCKDRTIGGSELKDCILTTPYEDDAVLIAFSAKGRDGYFEWHSPKDFCKIHILIRTMEAINVDDKHIQQGPMERDEDAEVQPPVHDPK